MAETRVRRLPVVNNDGIPGGVLSIDDIITLRDPGKWQGCYKLSGEEIIRALKKLYGQESRVVHTKSAAA